jgi:hypothetical protein
MKLDAYFPSLEKFKALFRKTDPDTSKEAAESVPVQRLEKLVYEAIKAAPNGLTAEEIEKLIPGVKLNSITPRIAPLIKKGYIEDSGERRRASSGRSQRVLRSC